jgi:hypothetical protein
MKRKEKKMKIVVVDYMYCMDEVIVMKNEMDLMMKKKKKMNSSVGV